MIITASQAFNMLSDLINEHIGPEPSVIAIDGRAASGKTTFANGLAQKFGIPVIHTDDFFRPRDIDGRLNMAEFAGNFDLLRFKNEVVDKLKNNDTFSYGVFDCAAGRVTEQKEVAASKCYIVEGAYCLHPDLGAYSDIKLFFDIDKQIQKQRIILRNGEEGYRQFSKVWIPAEERYIFHYNIVSRCDHTII